MCVCVRNKTDIKKEKDILKRVTKRETRERQCVREIVLSSRDDLSKYWVSGEEKLCIEKNVLSLVQSLVEFSLFSSCLITVF